MKSPLIGTETESPSGKGRPHALLVKQQDLRFRAWITYRSSTWERLRASSDDHREIVADLPKADNSTNYDLTIDVDLSNVEPSVSGPNSVKILNSVSSLAKQEIKINKVINLQFNRDWTSKGVLIILCKRPPIRSWSCRRYYERENSSSCDCISEITILTLIRMSNSM